MPAGPLAINLAVGARIDGGMQQLVERQRLDAQHASSLVMRPSLASSTRCAAQPWRCACRCGSAASTACLLDREFEILHVAVMARECDL